MTLNARRSLSAPAFGLMLLVLSGCASTFDALPEKMGGLPESAPARPATPYAVPNVYDARPTREARPLSTDEQKKLETDLVTLREQQKNLANPPPPPPKAAAKPPSKTPAKAAAPKKEAAKAAEPKKKEPVVPDSRAAPLKPLN